MDSKTMQILRRDAEDICRSAIEASVPDAAIQRALGIMREALKDYLPVWLIALFFSEMRF